jgi:hypothetical protein
VRKRTIDELPTQIVLRPTVSGEAGGWDVSSTSRDAGSCSCLVHKGRRPNGVSPVRTRADHRLNDMFGPENTTKLAATYRDILISVTGGHLDRMPSRPVRLTIVSAMLAEADRGEFDPARLKEVALSALDASAFR